MTNSPNIDRLMSEMTPIEKVGQLNLITPGGHAATGAVVNEDVERKIRDGLVGGVFGLADPGELREFQKVAVEGSRLGIPILFAMDVIHGHRTIFPIPLALSCSWNMEMVRRSARIAAKEAAAEGIRQAYAPMIDVCRDPRWGRIAECPGEDPVLASRYAEAMVRGYQGDDLTAVDSMMACLKHFVAYGSCEGGRDYNNADVSPRRLRDVYLAPFLAGVKAGAGSIMASFNAVNGRPMHANGDLLTKVLRDEWGFDGIVVSDYTGVLEMIDHGLGDLSQVSAEALRAGVDQDMVSEGYVGTILRSVEEGRISMDEIDRGCRRVLLAKERLGLLDDPFRYLDVERAKVSVLLPEHLALARAAAAECCVLLKNDGALPLARSGSVALVGPLADDWRNMLGTWAVAGAHEKSVPVLAGMRAAGGGDVDVRYALGAHIVEDRELANRLNVHGEIVVFDERPPEALIDEAVETAKASDVIVAVVGEAREASGEASSTSNPTLPENQRRLIRALKETGKPLVLLVLTGRPLVLREEAELADALLIGWFGGSEAGNAFADVLFGDATPSGKLSTTFPYTVGQIPVFHAREPTGRPYRGPIDGFAKFRSCYLDSPLEGLFPFGFGLSYTSFALSRPDLDKPNLKGDDDRLTITLQVTNTGERAGAEVVQLYLSDPVASLSQPIKRLIDFKKVTLRPGETADVAFEVGTDALRFHKAESLIRADWVWEPGEFVFGIGTDSRNTVDTSVIWEA